MAGSLELGKEELEDRLRQFDRAVGLMYPGQSFQIVLVGGGAMVLLGCLARSTADLDALQAPRELVDLNIRRPEVLEELDWKRLDEVANDMQGSKMNDRRYEQFLHNYRQYRQECGPCDL